MYNIDKNSSIWQFYSKMFFLGYCRQNLTNRIFAFEFFQFKKKIMSKIHLLQVLVSFKKKDFKFNPMAKLDVL